VTQSGILVCWLHVFMVVVGGVVGGWAGSLQGYSALLVGLVNGFRRSREWHFGVFAGYMVAMGYKAGRCYVYTGVAWFSVCVGLTGWSNRSDRVALVGVVCVYVLYGCY